MNREAELFAEAIELAASERAAFLDRACADNAILRATVEALLRGHAQAQRVFATPVADRQISDIPTEKPGDVIGRYTLLEKIGEGGCGVVWRAEQREPVRREVALKVIKLGMDTREVIARFEAERQALAMMDHPNIARVFDGGATDGGRPFFVMELVRGIPITKYCDENHLTPTERLELFIQVCQAVQHAHQKGIIHRDLKPSNILVTDGRDSSEVARLDLKPLSSTGKPAAWGQAAPPPVQPSPKVIDFGIAKATQGRLTDETIHTAFEQFIGTPAYMSPEQTEFGNSDIDTRSDIYSLGVLLYELLTGRPPFDPKTLGAGSVEEIRRVIREVDPPRPSTRLTTIGHDERAALAQCRGIAPAQLSSMLRGDLDWIVMRCLEKERARRYDTANGIAMDLRRHLRHEPVVARPPNRAYLLQKLIRRHRTAFGAAAAIAAVLVLGAMFSTWQAIRATQAEREQIRLRETEAKLRSHAEAQELAARESEKEQRRLRDIEADLRQRAETQELAFRRRVYAADMRLAQQVLAVDNQVRARELLNRHKPAAGELDLRGWEWRYLWQQCQSDFAHTIRQRPPGIWSLALSGDGKSLAVVDSDGRLNIWLLSAQKEISVPLEAVERVAFAPRGPLLAASASRANADANRREHYIALWNTETGHVEKEIPLVEACGGLFFSEDGEYLAVATIGGPESSPKGRIMRWRISDGVELDGIDASVPLPQWGTQFAATRDLGLVAHKVPLRRFRVTELQSGKELWTREAVAEGNDVSALAFSRDGRLLASSGAANDPTIGLWDVTTGNLLRRLEGHRNWVGSLLFWPDGRTLASASADRTIRLWDVETGRLRQTLRGHKLDVFALALLPDKRTLISGGKEGAVYLWDTEAERNRLSSTTLPQPIEAWRFGEDSQSILTVDSGGRVTRWHGSGFREMTPIMELGRVRYNLTWFQRIVISPDLRHIVVRPDEAPHELRLWDTQDRTLRHTFVSPARAMFVPAVFLDGDTLVVFDQRDETSVLCREWDLPGSREKRSWRIPTPIASSVDLHVWCSPDRRWWLARGSTGDAITYDAHTATSVRANLTIAGPGAPQFSPDGRLLAIAAMGTAVTKLWETSTYREIATLTNPFKTPHSAVFSPDGTRLAVGAGGNEAIVLWDVASHEPVLSLESNLSLFYRPAFSPDGRYIGARSTIGANGILHLWRAPSWEEIEAAEKAQSAAARR